jgi:hypothetical protein
MTDDEKTLPKRPDQSRIKVTKEELDASGLSLRDYMNKQKGLTRRDGSAPESMGKTSTPAAKASSSKAGPSATPSAGSQMGPGSSATKSESPKFKSPIVKFFEGIRERGDKDLAERGMKKGGMAYAKGGSASSRADGIASKGKTRGKMC